MNDALYDKGLAIRRQVLGALNNGVTKDEMRKVFLRVSAYCGWPAPPA